jgi:hypothetical protein
MSQTSGTPASDYLHATPEQVASLANKLLEFSQGLDPVERALFLECIKRGLPTSVGKQPDRPVDASLAVFAAWLNSVVSDPSRWYPS